MGNTLYVGNLPDQTSTGSLRGCFAEYGQVSEVRIVADRETGRSGSAALVTMRTEGAAKHAIVGLDGAILGGRTLCVKRADERSPPEQGDKNNWRTGMRGDRKKAADDKRRTRITQQFREPHNMTYELDCVGVPLIVRIFFPIGDGPALEWRIEARTSDAPDAAVATAAAPSRAQALRTIAEWWHENQESRGLSTLDWEGVALAMAEVRAL
jgi:RNA recognition motif-containing protein